MTIRKWQILTVLEDGRPRTAVEVAIELERRFGSRCRVNSVRKDLERYSDRRQQRLLSREKKRGSRLCFHYTITERGRRDWNTSIRENLDKNQNPSLSRRDPQMKIRK